jgi:hypothetical protein
MIDTSGGHTQADIKLQAAVVPTRTLFYYTLTATFPLILISGVLLFTNLRKNNIILLSLLGAITGILGLTRLLYEMTMDIAGYPTFKLPIWSVFYLIIYVISLFTFLFFALHVHAPDVYFGGFHTSNYKAGFLDCLYVSLCDYIGSPPDNAISIKKHLPRFLTVSQGVISMFINVVIITKFVNAF